ncbi:MAG: 50S ribosomal protein L25/general stress protein Ctc [Salinarimonadaceae bacterium]|nr:MAG: 50S ribosomal protein L25/general stress protein Ctc [Salinarimonadaceae bacterium]
MSDIKKLSAVARERVGKGAAREIRRQGAVPAVIYGAGKPARAITLNFRDINKLIFAGGFQTTLFEIDVAGDKERAIPRDFQLDPIKDRPLHVDFLRVSKGQTLAVEVPVHFHNHDKSKGLKRGGTLNVVRHTVELYVPADDIPDGIEIDLTDYDMGDSIHVSQVKLPGGATPVIQDRDFTIATIAVPAGYKDEDEVEGEGEGEDKAAEPEA